MEVKSDVIYDRNREQATTTITNKYNVDIYKQKTQKNQLYDYEIPKNAIYNNKQAYAINLNTSQKNQLFTSQLIYPPTIEADVTKISGLLIGIIICQIIFICIYVGREFRRKK